MKTCIAIADWAACLHLPDVEAGFTMHLGRTGEAFFLGEEVDDGSGAFQSLNSCPAGELQ